MVFGSMERIVRLVQQALTFWPRATTLVFLVSAPSFPATTANHARVPCTLMLRLPLVLLVMMVWYPAMVFPALPMVPLLHLSHPPFSHQFLDPSFQLLRFFFV